MGLVFYCSVLTFPLKMHYRGENRQNREGVIGFFTRNEITVTFGPLNSAKFHQNRIKIATVGAQTNRQTERQKDASDFTTCYMHCYRTEEEEDFRIDRGLLHGSSSPLRRFELVRVKLIKLAYSPTRPDGDVGSANSQRL